MESGRDDKTAGRQGVGRWRPYHGGHRARSHADAHADEHAAVEQIPEHPLIPQGPPALLTTQAQVDEFLDHLRATGRFAYDSEFIGEQSYVPRLCVVQLATCARIALIDALAEVELTRFWELLADASVEKVVHAGLQDLEPVMRILGRPAINVFDVQIAAGFCGLPYPTALGKLVAEFTGVELPKGPKFSQWDRRPLSAVQMRYAANDVRYLCALREALGERLAEKGNLAWAIEEGAALSDPALYTFDPETAYMKLLDRTRLDPRRVAVVRALVTWRDQAARVHDVPPRALVKDGVLTAIARERVVTLNDLARIRGLPWPVREEYGDSIIAAIAAANALPEFALPTPIRDEETHDEERAIDEAWAAVQAVSTAKAIDPKVVTSRRELARLYLYPSTDSRLRHGWRRELLAPVIGAWK